MRTPPPPPHRGPDPSTLDVKQAEGGDQSYLQVLPPDVDGRKGQLHLLPAGVFMAFVGDFDKDEEDPCRYASSHQHEDPCWPPPKKKRQTDRHRKEM